MDRQIGRDNYLAGRPDTPAGRFVTGTAQKLKRQVENMCGHEWMRVNDIFVCLRCGLTRTYDGKILFDRKLSGMQKRKKGRHAKRA